MKRIILILILGMILVYGCGSSQNPGVKVTMFKSATCGCCAKYVPELKKAGFQVEIVNMPDMSSIKERYNIPRNMESCHTTVIGDYFVEGHIPKEAINKLLEEKPTIQGIALPGMPAGSPGMPGVKTAPFKIYALSNGEISEFMII